MRFVNILALACVVVVASAANNTRRDLDTTPKWLQCDKRWGSDRLGTCSSDTICSAGCAITSVSMYIASRGYGGNPGSFNKWLKNNGGYASGCLIYWAKVDNLGFSSWAGIQNPTYDTVCSSLEKGNGIIANVNNGHHYVLVTGCAGSSKYNVHDPAGRRDTFSHSEVKTFAVYHKK